MHYEEGDTLGEEKISDGFDLEVAWSGDVEYLTHRSFDEDAFFEGDVFDGENGGI